MRSQAIPGPATLLAVLAVGASVPAVLTAQTVPSPYEFIERSQDLGGYAAWLLTDRGSADLGPKSGATYGLHYGIRLSDPLGFGAVAGFMRAERDIIDPSAEGGPATLGTSEFTLVMLAGRLQLNLTGARTWHDLQPYVLIGLGVAFDATGSPTCGLTSTELQCTLDPDERFGFNTSVMGQAGLGTAWLPSQRFGLRLTLHDNIWRIEAPPGFLDPELELETFPPEKEWLNNIQLTAALSYWF